MSGASSRRVPLEGSERHPLIGARAVGPSDAAERFEVSVHLRPRAPLPALGTARLSRGDLAALHGASDGDVALVAAFADAHGLQVDAVHAARRTVVLSGNAAAMMRAFEVELQRWERGEVRFRGRLGAVHIPESLSGVIEGVFGLDDRPQARSRVWRRAAGAAATRGEAFTPPQVAALYDFPRGLDGRGQTVALLQLGGGWSESDLSAYFTSLGVHVPQVVNVSVDHGRNLPSGDAASDDSEVMLDVEVAGSIVPAARIALYFAPNTERGFLDGVSAAIHDEQLAPSVLSISWGAAEPTWTRQALRAIDGAFQAAAALGVTVCAAAGDSGSGDDVHDGRAHVDFPASSPGALACGGTRLSVTHGELAGEEVWNDGRLGGSTGGGVSAVFAPPPWQHGLGRRGRGVPDVAGNADPQTGYLVRVDGAAAVLGGTSAVAPLWAALVAMANQRRGTPVGLLTPLLYRAATGDSPLRDVTEGRNGRFRAGPGWDACTGLGTPRGGAVVSLLAGE